MAQSLQQARLCPHCANSIALDAEKCPYCNAQVSPEAAPQWAEKNTKPRDSAPIQSSEKRGVKPIFVVLGVALLVGAFGVFLLSYWPSDARLAGQPDRSSELREREEKIQNLEAELAKLRAGNQGSSSQLGNLKAQLEESQKDLAEAERKLANANREIERLRSANMASAPRSAARGNDASRTAAAPPPRRGADPGVYETRHTTSVFEEPAGSSRVLTQIGRGTRVNVVRSIGDWLEVRSKHGKPPGFIRADDAMFVGKAN